MIHVRAVVLGRTRRPTAIAGGAVNQKGHMGSFALCSVVKDAGVKVDPAAAEAKELQSILTMQALKLRRRS